MIKVYLKGEGHRNFNVGYIYDDGMVTFPCKSIIEASEMDCSELEKCKTAEEAAARFNTKKIQFNSDDWEIVDMLSCHPTYFSLTKLTADFIVDEYDQIDTLCTMQRLRDGADVEHLMTTRNLDDAKNAFKEHKTKIEFGQSSCRVTEYVVLKGGMLNGELNLELADVEALNIMRIK